MPDRLLMADRAGTVLASCHGVGTGRHCYTPFGALQPLAMRNQSAFTGQWMESAAGLYMLGEGYRGYQATLGRFAQPDRHSPFGEGGPNAYAYCAGDPVNRVDRTGRAFASLVIGGIVNGIAMTALHLTNLGSKSMKATSASMMWGTRLALLASGASVAAGVIAGAQADQQAQSTLAWASIGLGVGSVALRITVFAPMIWQAGARRAAGRVFGVRRSYYAKHWYMREVQELKHVLA